MSIPLESAVVMRICRLLRDRGAWYVKTTGVAKVGCPDLVVCYRGYFLGIEVKRSKKSTYGVTRKQELELQRIARSGGLAVVAYGVEDVLPILDQIDSDNSAA